MPLDEFLGQLGEKAGDVGPRARRVRLRTSTWRGIVEGAQGALENVDLGGIVEGAKDALGGVAENVDLGSIAEKAGDVVGGAQDGLGGILEGIFGGDKGVAFSLQSNGSGRERASSRPFFFGRAVECCTMRTAASKCARNMRFDSVRMPCAIMHSQQPNTPNL